MEARDYLKLYLSHGRLILGIMTVATVVTVVVAASQPVRQTASISLAVNRINSEATPDYQFDGYYALQAVELFSQTVVSWFDTPSLLHEIYTRAKVDPELESLNGLTNRFRVKRYSPQNIVVRLTERNETRARQLADALPPVLEERADRLNQDPTGKPLFEIVSATPVIAPSRPNILLAAGLALVLGFGLALLVVAGRHYLR